MVTAKPQPAPAASSSSYTAPPPRNRFGENLPNGILPRLPPVDPRPRPIRDFISTRLYKLVLATLYLVYSVYLKLRWTYHTALNRGFSILYYHHRTPQLIQQDVMEVKANGKLPKHLSVIVEYEKGGLDTLIDEVAEITCWCASAGIKHLSVYEQTGMPSLPSCNIPVSNLTTPPPRNRSPQILHLNLAPLHRPASPQLLW